MSSAAGVYKSASSSTLPSSDRKFPPNDRVSSNDAPWVTRSGFDLSSVSAQSSCGGPSSTMISTNNGNCVCYPDVLVECCGDSCKRVSQC